MPPPTHSLIPGHYGTATVKNHTRLLVKSAAGIWEVVQYSQDGHVPAEVRACVAVRGRAQGGTRAVEIYGVYEGISSSFLRGITLNLKPSKAFLKQIQMSF